MKHFTKQDGSLWAFAADGSQDHLITDDMVEVSDETLAELQKPTPNQLWTSLQANALVALEKSGVTIERCVENNVSVPTEWADYRKKLRAIVGATTIGSDLTLPKQPEYPAGT